MKFIYASLVFLAVGADAFVPSAPSAFGVVSSRQTVQRTVNTGCPSGCDCGSCAQKTHGTGCNCGSCQSKASKASGCNCGNCGSAFALCSQATSDEVVPEAVPDVVASIDDAGAGGADAAHSVTRDKGDDAAKAKKGNKVNKKAISELSVGQELVGKVKTVASYGAFVDLGYASDGLVHISRIADDFVSNVEDHLKAGQEVTVRVISIDLEKKQVALTMRSEEAEANADSDATARKEKRSKKPRRSGGDRAAQAASATALARSSWDTEKFIEGEVASVLDFGAFVRFDSSLCGEGLSGELDGLVHISALRKERVEDVSSIVSVGDKVQIRVKSVDEESGKVSLSMVSKEDEPAPRKGGGGGGGGDKKDRGPRLDDIFAAETMGAADWSDSMGKFEQPSFTNNVIIKGQ